MPVIEREIGIFIHAVLMGMILYAGYLSFVVLRHLFTHKKWMVHGEDFLYWSCVSIYLFVQNYHTNNGKIRWFSVLGIVLGTIFLRKIRFIVGKIIKKMYTYVERKFLKNS